MSYKNVFFGFLKPHPYFNSREGDELDGTEENTYLPESFVLNTLLKEKKFNIGFHINVYNPNSVGVAFYLINGKTYYGEDIKRNLGNSVANIQTHIDSDDKELTIKWLDVNEEFRGGGLGKFLITLVLLYTSKFNEDVVTAVLDDDSDNYANGIDDPDKRRLEQSKNIYCKMGFVYEDETGGPEMRAIVKEILKKNLSHTELEPESEDERGKKRPRARLKKSKKKKHKKKKHTRKKKR